MQYKNISKGSFKLNLSNHTQNNGLKTLEPISAAEKVQTVNKKLLMIKISKNHLFAKKSLNSTRRSSIEPNSKVESAKNNDFIESNINSFRDKESQSTVDNTTQTIIKSSRITNQKLTLPILSEPEIKEKIMKILNEAVFKEKTLKSLSITKYSPSKPF